MLNKQIYIPIKNNSSLYFELKYFLDFEQLVYNDYAHNYDDYLNAIQSYYYFLNIRDENIDYKSQADIKTSIILKKDMEELEKFQKQNKMNYALLKIPSKKIINDIINKNILNEELTRYERIVYQCVVSRTDKGQIIFNSEKKPVIIDNSFSLILYLDKVFKWRQYLNVIERYHTLSFTERLYLASIEKDYQLFKELSITNNRAF